MKLYRIIYKKTMKNNEKMIWNCMELCEKTIKLYKKTMKLYGIV